MEMNNLRVESHVAQKNRRHKLRFQHNPNDINHQQQPSQDHHQSFSYSHNVFPSEMINSIARNPHLLLPQGHSYVSHDQDSYSGSGQPERFLMSSSGSQECNKWKSVVSSHQEGANDHWNVVSYSNNVSMNSGSYSYHQDDQQPFYHGNIQQDHVTIAQHPSTRPCWMNNSNSDGPSFLANRIHDHQEQTTQALSLSLSSVSQLKDDQPMLESGHKTIKSDLLPNSDPKSIMGVSSFAHRSVGPLGPFTGYATILKNSKYMKSAQELLNESCDVGYQEMVPTCHEFYSQKILEDEMSRASDYSGGSEDHINGRSSSGADSFRPEFQRKKAKLLYMQDEVCRRYKQYLQQMQMVISSFETVAGLSAATPYVCLALKVVSRHFHLVKNVISEQLSQMRKMLKSMDHRLGKPGGGAAGYFSSQQPAWRPQRGLPERAISVLKTWLFDHFLHPYPSDADKHMLATQTGLTRNQVSNL
uniref:BEL1-like homeodomain protein 8 n=1 Tax=Tanacetum cinerariifolium TaxID=118510 RepID=A0A6L2JKS7_TANCI|nr:BEL1-like homeodomain protein 8 [Tanacetum cinerariifolium]